MLEFFNNFFSGLTVNNFLDVFFIILAILIALIGFHRGAANCLIGVISIVLSVCFSTLIAPKLSAFLNSTFGLNEIFAGWIENAFNISMETDIEDFSIPAFLVTVIGSTHTIETLSAALGEFAVTVVCSFIFFMIFMPIFHYVGRFMTNLIKRIPIIRILDGMVGAVFYLGVAAIITYALFLILSLFCASAFAEFVDGSIVFGYMYNHNILGFILA